MLRTEILLHNHHTFSSVMLGRKYNVVEVYAGTGRSAEAFRRWNRCRIGLLVDHEPYAAETYRHNFPDAPYLVGDASRLTADEIEIRAGGKVDILLGCPPCQGFSDTGTRDLDDPRNAHLTRFTALTAHLRPLAVALENVPLAGTTKRFHHFVSVMEALRYRGVWGILNAARRGSTQCRQRLVYIGVREDVGVVPSIKPPTHGGSGEYFNYSTLALAPVASDPIAMLSESPGARRARKAMPYQETELGPAAISPVGTILDGLPPIGSPDAKRLSHERWAHTAHMMERMSQVPEGGRWAGGADHFSHSYGRLHRQGLARTLTGFFSNPGSGRFWHPTEDRALSLREAARLQGFPDSFRFLGHATKNTRLVGNALDAVLADTTLEAVRSALD